MDCRRNLAFSVGGRFVLVFSFVSGALCYIYNKSWNIDACLVFVCLFVCVLKYNIACQNGGLECESYLLMKICKCTIG